MASSCSMFSTRMATQTSNRKVPAEVLGGLDGDSAPARAIVELQDREIGERSGRSRGQIKSIKRARKA